MFQKSTYPKAPPFREGLITPFESLSESLKLPRCLTAMISSSSERWNFPGLFVSFGTFPVLQEFVAVNECPCLDEDDIALPSMNWVIWSLFCSSGRWLPALRS